VLEQQPEERVTVAKVLGRALRAEAAEEAGRLAERREPVRDDGLVAVDKVLQLTQGADVGLELQPTAAERPAETVSAIADRPTHLGLSEYQLKAAS